MLVEFTRFRVVFGHVMVWVLQRQPTALPRGWIPTDWLASLDPWQVSASANGIMRLVIHKTILRYLMISDTTMAVLIKKHISVKYIVQKTVKWHALLAKARWSLFQRQFWRLRLGSVRSERSEHPMLKFVMKDACQITCIIISAYYNPIQCYTSKYLSTAYLFWVAVGCVKSKYFLIIVSK